MPRRTKSQIKVIDHYIRTEYPENGPGEIAEKLGEKVSYITTRAHYLGIKKDRGAISTDVSKQSKKQLISLIKDLRERNETLRLELIKKTDQLRKIYG